jgi:hypothetical protein
MPQVSASNKDLVMGPRSVPDTKTIGRNITIASVGVRLSVKRFVGELLELLELLLS